MEDGAVTFKGGSISETKAVGVRAPSASCASPRRGVVCFAVQHGRWMARTVRRTHAAASGVRSTAHAAGMERVSTPFFIVAEGATPSGRGVLHSGVRAACAARCTCARHAPRGEGSQREDACIEAYCVPKPRSGPVPPRCMRYRMRRCGMRCACCTGARWRVGALHRFRVASEQYIALSVASTCRIDACCIGASARIGMLHRCALHVASVRVACCIGARCIGARSIGALHWLVLPRPPCCIGAAQLSRSAVCRVIIAVLTAGALLDWVKGRLLRLPSGGAMRSCAG
jgi:hypothetical protein